MSSNQPFVGKVAMVTGAARGIGAATAREFAHAGATLVLCDLSDDIETIAAEINSFGGKASAIAADIANPNTAKTLVELALDKYQRLDFAFNNAGIGGKPAGIGDVEIEDWQRVIDVNLSSLFYCMKYQLPAIEQTGGGVIINNASVCGLRPIDGSSIEYTAAKHGVIGLTKQVAVNHAVNGVRCNAVCPGLIQTQLTADQDCDAFLTRIPQKRLGTPEDIARVVRMLCSDESSYINGAAIPVDGGYMET
jgi:NAD(P)-dependent dehydrogenase (short-subunit alcohol dehydrogenase family)